jgi:hypothetical protein
MSDCIGYTSKIWDYFVPFNTLDTVCFSYDKTKMFIVSSIRVAMYIVVLFILQGDSSSDKGVPEVLYKKIIYYVLLLCIVINLLALLAIMIKIPKYSKKLV